MSKKKNVAGGAATGGGINFQAAVSAVVAVYVLRGQPLQWLSGVVDDVPVSLEAETGGAGDDISLVLSSGNTVEVQIKKGLQSGSKLWDSLIAISKAINDGTTDYGVLIVSPSSSNTIKENLSKDIIRLGDGRTDGLSGISEAFKSKLEGENLPVIECCKRIRIQVIYANGASQADIKAAQSELAHLCRDKAEILAAWGCLERDAADLIEKRGRRDVSSTLRLLDSKGIKLTRSSDSSPLIILKKLTKWIYETNSDFSIFGIAKSLRVDEAWIPLRAIVKGDSSAEVQTLGDALKKYQSWEFQTIDRDAKLVNPETLCRFVRRAILVGGPGMGKTTLLKRIARRYSEDAIPVLQLKLKLVAARMQSGSSFEESVFSLSLDGCGVDLLEVKKANFPNWVLLCDGLDECGSLQEHVATGVTRFAIGHPDCRVLVTTRPVGYEASHFSDWRHYDLAPLDPSDAISNVKMLLVESLPEHSEFLEEAQNLLSIGDEAKAAIARSPLLLGLSASIIARGGKLEGTKEKLFEQIFELIDEVPRSRAFQVPSSRVLLGRYLDSVGWYLTLNPLCKVTELLKLTAQGLMKDMGSNSFKAAADAEDFLKYWQDVGMIERIRHGFEETLTFIHKSFGAYVTSRYIFAMPSTEQTKHLIKVIADSEWQEVIEFAAQAGLTNNVCIALLSGNGDFVNTTRLAQAIGLLATATPAIDRDLSQTIINEAYSIILSDNESAAFKVGAQLVEVAKRFPDDASPLAQGLLVHEQSWTRVIAWAVTVVAGENYYEKNRLVDALPDFLNMPIHGVRSSLSGAMFTRYGDEELLGLLALKILSILVNQPVSDGNEEVIIKIIDWMWLGRSSDVDQALSLFIASNKYPQIVSVIKKKASSVHSPDILKKLEAMELYWIRVYEALFDLLEVPRDRKQDISVENQFLNLSAFLIGSEFESLSLSDHQALIDSQGKDAVRAVLFALVELMGISHEDLKKEGLLARNYLQSKDEGKSKYIHHLLTEVDPSPIAWNESKLLSLDLAKVETALFNPSLWIVWIAANLIENIVSRPRLELLFCRLVKEGNGPSLAVSSSWLEKVNHEIAIPILLERLSKPLVDGCHYLYEALYSIEVLDGINFFVVLKNGLYADIATACAAAKLVVKVTQPDDVVMATLIKESFDYWKSKELEELQEAQDSMVKVVRDSPRKNLLEAQLKQSPLSYENLVQNLHDDRSDIQDLATNELLRHLVRTKHHRVIFLNDILIGKLPPFLLSKVVEVIAPLSTSEFDVWKKLILHENANIRFSSMSLMSGNYLDEVNIRYYASSMKNDGERQIRSKANNILNMLGDN